MMFLFFKWLHIVAIISWMAGALYLFRLFVYHRESGVANESIGALLTVMETRLYRYITVPAMMVAWVAGLSMISLSPSLASSGWLQAKLVAVVLLTIGTLHGKRLITKFQTLPIDQLPTGKKLRVLNEVPTILMFVIVGLVVFKPF